MAITYRVRCTVVLLTERSDEPPEQVRRRFEDGVRGAFERQNRSLQSTAKLCEVLVEAEPVQ